MTRWGSRSVRVAHDLHVGDPGHRARRIRSTRACCRRVDLVALGDHRLERGRRGQRGRARSRTPPPARRPGRRRGRGCASGRPCGPAARRRRRGRPTCGRSRRRRPSRPGAAAGPAEAQASVNSGTPSGSPSPASGCSVPTSWLAACTRHRRHARTRGRLAQRRRGRPGPAGRPPTSVEPPTQAAAWRTAACSTAEWTTAPAPARWPRTSPSRPRWTASVPEPVKLTSSGRTPRLSATTARALSSSSRAVAPGVVQPPRVGVPLVERGQQGLARGRVQRLGRGGVEVDGRWRRGRRRWYGSPAQPTARPCGRTGVGFR